MRITTQKIAVSGIRPSQQYIGVQETTGVFASTTQIRITGVNQSAVIEVRKAPSRSISVSAEQDLEVAMSQTVLTGQLLGDDF
jgi:hypothetical protein